MGGVDYVKRCIWRGMHLHHNFVIDVWWSYRLHTAGGIFGVYSRHIIMYRMISTSDIESDWFGTYVVLCIPFQLFLTSLMGGKFYIVSPYDILCLTGVKTGVVCSGYLCEWFYTRKLSKGYLRIIYTCIMYSCTQMYNYHFYNVHLNIYNILLITMKYNYALRDWHCYCLWCYSRSFSSVRVHRTSNHMGRRRGEQTTREFLEWAWVAICIALQ